MKISRNIDEISRNIDKNTDEKSIKIGWIVD